MYNLNIKTITDFIIENKNHFKKIKNIPIHLFIVYIFPSISNISLYELTKGVKLLKESYNRRENEIQNLNTKNIKIDSEIQNLINQNIKIDNEIQNLINHNIKIDNEINILRTEIEKLKLNQNCKNGAKSSNTIYDINSNKKESEPKNINDIFDLVKYNNMNENEKEIYYFFSFHNNINNIINSNSTINSENLNHEIFNFIDNINMNNINNLNKPNIIYNRNINFENINSDLFNFIDNINLNNGNPINNNNSNNNNNLWNSSLEQTPEIHNLIFRLSLLKQNKNINNDNDIYNSIGNVNFNDINK